MKAARMAKEPRTTTSSLITNSSEEMAAAVRPVPRVMYEVFAMGELPGKALMMEAARDLGSSRAGVVLANRRPEAAGAAATEPRRAAVDEVRARLLIANDMAVAGPCVGVCPRC